MAAVPLHHRPIESKPNLRVVARSRSKSKSDALPRLIVFSVLAFGAFMASSLAGNVMLEKSRQEGKSALRRTLAAREYQSALQRQVIALSGVNSVEAWAKANGFVPSERAPQTSSENSRVAINR